MSAPKKQTGLTVVNTISNLALGASSLKIICDKIDDGAEMTSVIKEQFSEALLKTQDGVDEFLAYRALIDARYEYAKHIKQMADAEMKKAESVKAASDLRAMELIDAFPDQPFIGSMMKLGTAKNPPSVDVSIPMAEKTYRNIIDVDVLDMFDLPGHYYTGHTIFCLNLKAIGDDLKANKELAWAQLRQGKRINTKLRDK